MKPNVVHIVVEQIDQHQPIAVQDVLAAFIARTHLETNAHFITYLRGYWCCCKTKIISRFLKSDRWREATSPDSWSWDTRTRLQLFDKNGGRLVSRENDLLFLNIPSLICSYKCPWGCRKRRNSSHKFEQVAPQEPNSWPRRRTAVRKCRANGGSRHLSPGLQVKKTAGLSLR